MAYGNYGDGPKRFGGSSNGRFGGQRRSFSPVKEGDELDVRIEAVGAKGDGIAKKEGFVLFVPNVKEGDEVRIKISKVLRKVGFAEVIGQAQGPIAEDKPREKAAPAAAEEEATQDVEESEDSQDSEEF